MGFHVPFNAVWNNKVHTVAAAAAFFLSFVNPNDNKIKTNRNATSIVSIDNTNVLTLLLIDQWALRLFFNSKCIIQTESAHSHG